MNTHLDPKQLKILIVNSLVASDGMDQALQQQVERTSGLRMGLLEGGYNIVTVLSSDVDLLEQIALLQPDVIVFDQHSDAALKNVVEATSHQPRPIVCFTDDNDKTKMHTAIELGVSAYDMVGLSAERVIAVLDVAIARFKVEQKLRAELSDLKQKLAERKVIERAKGLLMARHQWSEEMAFRTLRTQAMNQNAKIYDLARHIIDTGEKTV
jgi:response regulator NasT